MRLMKDGTGRDYTDPDHPGLAGQLYASYARAVQARVLASVVGEEGLGDTDARYLAFGTAFGRPLQSHQRLADLLAAEYGRFLGRLGDGLAVGVGELLPGLLADGQRDRAVHMVGQRDVRADEHVRRGREERRVLLRIRDLAEQLKNGQAATIFLL